MPDTNMQEVKYRMSSAISVINVTFWLNGDPRWVLY